MHKYVNRLISGEPIQYILQEWDFRYLKDLKMKHVVLIPRWETEELVDVALQYLKEEEEKKKNGGEEEELFLFEKKIRFLEIGIGTG